MSGTQAMLYIVASAAAGAAWIGVGILGRKAWERATRERRR